MNWHVFLNIFLGFLVIACGCLGVSWHCQIKKEGEFWSAETNIIGSVLILLAYAATAASFAGLVGINWDAGN